MKVRFRCKKRHVSRLESHESIWTHQSLVKCRWSLPSLEFSRYARAAPHEDLPKAETDGAQWRGGRDIVDGRRNGNMCEETAENLQGFPKMCALGCDKFLPGCCLAKQVHFLRHLSTYGTRETLRAFFAYRAAIPGSELWITVSVGPPRRLMCGCAIRLTALFSAVGIASERTWYVRTTNAGRTNPASGNIISICQLPVEDKPPRPARAEKR